MTQTEALRLALEALKSCNGLPHWPAFIPVTDAIKAALEAKDEAVAHSVVAGALFDFMGWLTSREKRLILSSVDEVSPAVEAITEFAKKRNLSLKNVEVGYWMEFLSTPPQQEAKGEIDWKDMYEKQKRRSEMWVAKYEKDIGPLEKAVPHQEAKDEPVALVVYRGEICYQSTDDDQSFGMWCPVNYDSKHGFADGTKFYTNPPQRTWVGLTDEEIDKAWRSVDYTVPWDQHRIDIARAIEAKLKERNG